MIETLPKEIMSLFSHDRSALTLEIIAEAGRNPKFLDLVARVNDPLRLAFRSIIEPLLRDLPQQEIDERAETLLVMARGLAVHICTRPTSDYRLLAATFRSALRGVLVTGTAQS
ncbi:TetR family transcriptional regulator C-terminal domain-containing protein [Sphingobium sp. AN558]|uniref:TetR family transcriptional regulator C-terminal domain-containing protein n=1 Tax=Sphingobium sp. AN558 TaxID=3133442 RepID=UPI0030BC2C11